MGWWGGGGPVSVSGVDGTTALDVTTGQHGEQSSSARMLLYTEVASRDLSFIKSAHRRDATALWRSVSSSASSWVNVRRELDNEVKSTDYSDVGCCARMDSHSTVVGAAVQRRKQSKAAMCMSFKLRVLCWRATLMAQIV